MRTPIPLSDYAVWALTVAAECYCLWKLRGPQRRSSIQAVKFYLKVQIASTLPMVLIALMSAPRHYYLAFIADTLLEYAAEIQIVAGIFYDIKGKSTVWGPVRVWILVTAVLGSVLGLFGAVRIHEGVPAWLATLQAFGQMAGFVRIAILIGVVAFSILMAGAWVRSIAHAWLGLAVFVIADFSFTELTIYRPDWVFTLRYGPTIVFFVSLFLWSTSVGGIGKAVEASGTMQSQSTVAPGWEAPGT